MTDTTTRKGEITIVKINVFRNKRNEKLSNKIRRNWE
jgi:hypothetical protein